MFQIVFGVVLFMFPTMEMCESKKVLVTGHPFSDPKKDDVHGQHNKVNERFHLIFPGTKWCGPGDIATSYEDLGQFRETDMCCRDHDHCENIPGGGEKYGLKNNDLFTRLHCDCDKQFFFCLHNANETISHIVGRQYFLFRNRCYKEAHPAIDCVQYQTRIFIRRCIQYQFDTTKPELYQWFDLPLYDIEDYPNDIDDNNIDEYYKRQAKHQNLINTRKLV